MTVRWRGWAGASALLAVFVLLAVHSTRGLGPTFDETTHLPAGYTYWRTGDFRLNPEHPPLVKRIAALPLLGMDLAFSTAWFEWRGGHQLHFGQRFLYDENAAQELLFRGRLPMIALGAVLGLLIFVWAKELGGPSAGLLALSLYAFSPEYIAHTRLVATDVPLALTAFGMCFFLWRAFERRSPAAAVASALCLGLALATKFSAVLLPPIAATYALLHRVLARRRTPLAAGLAAFALIPPLVVWASYGFEYGQPRRPSGRPIYQGDLLGSPPWSPVLVVGAAQEAARLHLLPEPFVHGFLAALRTPEGRLAFLNGATSASGWWYYFPLAALYKTPVPTLLACAAGLALLPRRLRERSWSHAALIAPPLLYLLVAATSALNIGHRHLLPIYPFLFVLAGDALARGLRARPQAAATGIALLLVWQVGSALRIHPHYLTYFNELAGGPAGGWRHLADSNLDWGQGLPALRDWLARRGPARVHLSYFGSAVPEHYGIDYEPLPSFLPLRKPWNGRLDLEPGDLLVVSATNLHPIFLGKPEFRNFVELLEKVRRDWQPLEVVANSIFVYEVP